MHNTLYEAQRLTLYLPATPSPDACHLHLSTDGLILDIWNASSPTGMPASSYPLDYISSIQLNSLAGGDTLLISNATLPTIESWLRTNRLYSSTATQHTTLVAFSQPDGSILVKLAYFGDVNADGAVNLNKYFFIDSNYLSQSPGTEMGFYKKGDVNLDGAINLNDYFLIDSAYLTQSGPLAMKTTSSTMLDQAAERLAPAKQPQEKAGRSKLFATRRIKAGERAEGRAGLSV